MAYNGVAPLEDTESTCSPSSRQTYATDLQFSVLWMMRCEFSWVRAKIKALIESFPGRLIFGLM